MSSWGDCFNAHACFSGGGTNDEDEDEAREKRRRAREERRKMREAEDGDSPDVHNANRYIQKF